MIIDKFFKLIGLIVIIVIVYLVYFTVAIYLPAGDDSIEKAFTIETGEGVNQISINLHELELIRNKWNFELYLWLKGMEGDLKAGDYLLNTNMSIIEIANALTRGRVVQEYTIRIIEGWNNQQIADYLEEKGLFDREKFLTEIENPKYLDKYGFLESRPKGVDLEGYLFPDTYRIFADATMEDVVEKMLSNFDIKITPKMRLDIKLQGKTIHNIITLASIIEKEVANDEDRAMVSDIFRKRLEVGMALQSDSTINYVLGTNTTRPTLEQLRSADSLYNTYKYRGLPPGPICNPSLSSIKAAIYPQKNDYWYFLTTEDGRVIYSETNDEHAKNKAKYLK